MRRRFPPVCRFLSCSSRLIHQSESTGKSTGISTLETPPLTEVPICRGVTLLRNGTAPLHSCVTPSYAPAKHLRRRYRGVLRQLSADRFIIFLLVFVPVIPALASLCSFAGCCTGKVRGAVFIAVFLVCVYFTPVAAFCFTSYFSACFCYLHS
jgi:hypothetical protein